MRPELQPERQLPIAVPRNRLSLELESDAAMNARNAAISLMAEAMLRAVVEQQFIFPTSRSPLLLDFARRLLALACVAWTGEIGGNLERERDDRADLRVVRDRDFLVHAVADRARNPQLDRLLGCVGIFGLGLLPVLRCSDVIAERAALVDERKCAELRLLTIHRPEKPGKGA